jgi:hypothetical protein
VPFFEDDEPCLAVEERFPAFAEAARPDPLVPALFAAVGVASFAAAPPAPPFLRRGRRRRRRFR